MARKIDFIIGGAQKSSTSYLASVLTSNQKIYVPDGEISYFQHPDYQDRNDDKLHDHFEGKEKFKLWGIKRPSYLCNENSPIYIKEYKEDIKLIFVLRDPVERAISALYHNMKYGFLPIQNASELFQQLLSNGLTSHPRSKEVIEYSRYSTHLNKWFELFNDAQILLVTQEELIMNTEIVINRVSKFLGITDSFKYKEPIFKKQETIYSYQRLKWVVKRNKFKFEYNKNQTRLYPKKASAVNELAYNFITAVDRFILKPIIGNNKNISNETKNALIQNFREDVNMLEHRLPSIKQYWKNFKPN